MSSFKLKLLLFSIIIIEGYFTLSTELIAIRQLAPYVGSNISVVSIIIASVLLPLSFGYYYGGRIKGRLRNKLFINLFQILIITSLGLSYVILDFLFSFLGTNIILNTFLYSILFLIYPVFLLGQTVPIISNFFNKESMNKATGNILFFSTIGSFLGSLVTTLLLMNYIGVNNTVFFNILLLNVIVYLLYSFKFRFFLFALVSLPFLILNNSSFLSKYGIVSDNSYSNIQIFNQKVFNQDSKVFSTNNNSSSILTLNNKSIPGTYIYFMDNVIFNESIRKNLNILVIGAGGFAIGVNDTDNNYTYVDINKDLKDIAEKHFLMNKLPDNKKFIPIDGRAFANYTKIKFDVVILDSYLQLTSIPKNLSTIQYLNSIKNITSKDGIVLINNASNAFFNDHFFLTFRNTINSAFPGNTYHYVTEPDFENIRKVELNQNFVFLWWKGRNTSNAILTDDLR